VSGEWSPWTYVCMYVGDYDLRWAETDAAERGGTRRSPGTAGAADG